MVYILPTFIRFAMNATYATAQHSVKDRIIRKMRTRTEGPVRCTRMLLLGGVKSLPTLDEKGELFGIIFSHFAYLETIFRIVCNET